MPAEALVYSQSCSMDPGQAFKVYGMIASHPEFSGMGMIINPDRRTYTPIQDTCVRNKEVLVTFLIPRQGVDMPAFYREFYNTLNHLESALPGTKEREHYRPTAA